MTIAQLCDHFEQRELGKENTWRSHATKKIYKAYLTRWVRPHWHKYELAEVRTIQVESWLRGLPLAKSSCAKIRNLMSVLFAEHRVSRTRHRILWVELWVGKILTGKFADFIENNLATVR